MRVVLKYVELEKYSCLEQSFYETQTAFNDIPFNPPLCCQKASNVINFSIVIIVCLSINVCIYCQYEHNL